jgi:hypothetical protein
MLRSRAIVPATKSPQKGYNASTKAKTNPNIAKAHKKAKAAEAVAENTTQKASATQQAKEYLEEMSEGDVGKARQGKRARNGEEDDDDEAAEMVAEAQMMVEEWSLTDIYLKEIEKRQEKTTDDVLRYNVKATLAKQLPKGSLATAKRMEIKNKLSSLQKLLNVYVAATKKRQDVLFDEAMKRLAAEKRAKKKRRINPDESEEDRLEVSDG